MIVLKTNCPKCRSICTINYTGNKSKDDLYYSSKPFQFTCDKCRTPYSSFGPHMFTASVTNIEFEEIE